MNFRDISRIDIIDFFNINNVKYNNLYTDALNLIDRDNVVLTRPVENWLIAYQHQNFKINVNHLSEYQVLFNDTTLTLNDVHQILYYLNIRDNNIDYLPNEILFDIMYHLPKFKVMKLLSTSLYRKYKSIVQSNLFKIKMSEKILINKGYRNFTFNMSVFDSIMKSNYILTPVGKMIKQIITIDNTIIYLSKQYKLYIYKDNIWYIAAINIPIHDVIFNYYIGYVYLSKGDVYTGTAEIANCYNYKVRQNKMNFDKLVKVRNYNNIISINCYNNLIYATDTIGNNFNLTL